jgi:hypothetical protein
VRPTHTDPTAGETARAIRLNPAVSRPIADPTNPRYGAAPLEPRHATEPPETRHETGSLEPRPGTEPLKPPHVAADGARIVDPTDPACGQRP